MTAPAPSPAEQAVIDRFGIFDEEERDLRTRMADVADNLDYYAGKTDGGTYAGGLSDAAGHIRDALAGVQDGGAAEALRRVGLIVDELADDESTGRPPNVPLLITALRAALAPQVDR